MAKKKSLYWTKVDRGEIRSRMQRLRGPAQVGAYHMLMYAYWDEDGSIPDNDALLANYVDASPEEWAAMAPVLRSYFRQCSDGRLRNPDWDADIAEAKRISEERSRASKMRKKKEPVVVETTATVIEMPKPPAAEPEPEPERNQGPDKRLSYNQVQGPRGQANLQRYHGISRLDSGDVNLPLKVCAGVKGHNVKMLDYAIKRVVDAMGKDDNWATDWQILVDWLNAGIKLDTIVEAIKNSMQRRRREDGPVYKVAYFDQAVRGLHDHEKRRNVA